MKPYGLIYMAKNRTNGMMYIGQTTDLSVRKSRHRSNAKSPRTYFENALAKYGMDGFEWTVLEYTAIDRDELDTQEKKWIAHYGTTNTDVGYNLTDGGWSNRNCTPELRTKMKVAALKKYEDGFINPHKGKKAQPHVIKALHAGRDKAIKERGHWNKGKTLTEAQCTAMTKSHNLFVNSPETEYAPRAILCVELNRIFSTISEAARYINRSISSIWGPLNGKGKTAAGYHWLYLTSAEIAARTTPSQDPTLSMDFDSSFPTTRQEDTESLICA